MGDLSDNFSRKEFACHCCGLCNVAPQLIVALQMLRHRLGVPIRIKSGCRCAAHNRAVGSQPTSRQVTREFIKGRAADITIDGLTPEEIAREAVQIEAFRQGGIGVYSWGVHLDVRNNPARWGKKWR